MKTNTIKKQNTNSKKMPSPNTGTGRNNLLLWVSNDARRAAGKWARRNWARRNWAREAKALANDTRFITELNTRGGNGRGWSIIERAQVIQGGKLATADNWSEEIIATFRAVMVEAAASWFDSASTKERQAVSTWLSLPIYGAAVFTEIPGTVEEKASFRSVWVDSLRKASKAAYSVRYHTRGRDGRELAAGQWVQSLPSSNKLNSDPKRAQGGGRRVAFDITLARLAKKFADMARAKAKAARIAGRGRGMESARNFYRFAEILSGEKMDSSEFESWIDENGSLTNKGQKRLTSWLERIGETRASVKQF